MKLFLKVFATLLFVLAIVSQVLAQSTRDIERAENERDLDLRSWNLRILQLQHERESKGRPRVLKLGRLIFSFVDNPFFKEASVVDTQLTAKARRDLEEIIDLSGQIKKNSEQLKNAGP